MIRVAIVDDQDLVRDGLALILSAESDIEVVCQAAHGRELLDVLDAGRAVDVVLLDLRMPILGGIATLSELGRRSRKPAVLVVTTFDRDELVLDAIASGADGYVLKSSSRADLLRAVRTVAMGGSVLAPEVTTAVLDTVRRQPSTIPVDLTDYHLTGREGEILQLVGRGLSNQEIADHLVLSTHTIKTHLTSILAKTGSRNRTHAALLAVRAGLV